jgi:hypothetical protein
MFLNALAWVVMLWAVIIGIGRCIGFYEVNTSPHPWAYKPVFTKTVQIVLALGVVAALWLVFGA